MPWAVRKQVVWLVYWRQYRDLGNPKHRKEVQDFWGGKEIGEPGLTATEMYDALSLER